MVALMTGFEISNEINIRPCRTVDFGRLREIWELSGITLGASDSPAELERLRLQNQDTCLVAMVNQEIQGCVMGGFDGRRGLVHHLAVHPNFRGKNIGRKLMEELDLKFRGKGVVKYSFWIEADNPQAIKFYRHLGYDLRDLITMSLTIRE